MWEQLKMRILMFTPGLGERGGAAKHSSLVAHELRNRGWDVKAVCRVGGSRRFTIDREDHFLAVQVPGFGNRVLGALLYYAVAVPLGIYWSVGASGILAIQLTSPAIAGGLVRTLTRKTLLVWSTTSGILGETAYLKKSRLGWVRRKMIKSADWVLAQTTSVRAELSEVVDIGRIVVIPTPTRVVAVAPKLRGNQRVLFAGRFAEEKNLILLLDAWSTLSSDFPEAELWMAGGGGTSRSIETEIRTKIATDANLDSVTLLGWVSDIDRLLADCDVFVLPSTTEGMSNALGEACGTGRVIVASRIAGNVEVLGEDYPLLFDPGDVHSLTVVLREALQNSDVRNRASSRARASAARLHASRVLEQIEALLRKKVS